MAGARLGTGYIGGVQVREKAGRGLSKRFGANACLVSITVVGSKIFPEKSLLYNRILNHEMT